MSYSPSKDPHLEMAAGRVAGVSVRNVFGETANADSGVDTDIWDAAAQPIWVAPTTARAHLIASTDAADTSAGAGCRTIQVTGLTSWGSDEITEDVIMNGTLSVTTTNSFVMINDLHMLTAGASGPNVGTISATAVTDGTLTSQIAAGEGQSQAAIVGIPSTKTMYMTAFQISVIKPGVGAQVQSHLVVNYQPDVELVGAFRHQHSTGIGVDGSSSVEHNFSPYLVVPGPAIVKLQGNSNAANTILSGGFDYILETN